MAILFLTSSSCLRLSKGERVRGLVERKVVHLAFVYILHEDHGDFLHIAHDLRRFIEPIEYLVEQSVAVGAALEDAVVPLADDGLHEGEAVVVAALLHEGRQVARVQAVEQVLREVLVAEFLLGALGQHLSEGLGVVGDGQQDTFDDGVVLEKILGPLGLIDVHAVLLEFSVHLEGGLVVVVVLDEVDAAGADLLDAVGDLLLFWVRARVHASVRCSNSSMMRSSSLQD